ncbi:MAG: hypothetical protein B6244_08890 [Candidatus Cloacimonetes bacterium 4572_55]|nr:MAG: hypothetical protein B6244_08890 [Candidatus Cloacimonetes bacterium 4572_55]
MDHYQDSQGSEIAIIGMSCRVPGAENPREFWKNLHDGVESITRFTDQELLESGVDQSLIDNPNYVGASGILPEIDGFDAEFFGISPREAEMMDPQQRIFLEQSWVALEDAGYDPQTYPGLIGVFGGSAMSTYLLNNIYGNRDLIDLQGSFQTVVSNDKDFLTTRVSYKLNLKGPSLDVQTACSTSLVAIHLACQSLLNGECDMALAGGISIQVPHRVGYLYQSGMVLSPDGHCRAFDANAQGMVGGSGVGIVALKPLIDALEDRDHVYAVIKGSAVNNDGSVKVGFTAPGLDGQADAISSAINAAGISAGTISYIEAHGTGTELGDPIEIAALTRAFRETSDQKDYCSIGSVKTNVGHLDRAAGVAGFIKAALALKYEKIPPSLHFQKPNPRIHFSHSPFYVNVELTDWPESMDPRRAGVSSFGLGGTNAHVILEEALDTAESTTNRTWQLVTLSARSKEALENATKNLADYFDQNREMSLADAAYTLHTGRRDFLHRRIAVCQNIDDAVDVLRFKKPERVHTGAYKMDDNEIVFMISGHGAHHVNMGEGLYRTEPLYREIIDQCTDILMPLIGLDIRDILYPDESDAAQSRDLLSQLHISQPTLFMVEYALAKLLISWGIRPGAMIGHSSGEYVAACISGVFSLEDGLTLISSRGRLIEKTEPGAMLTVPLPAEEVASLLEKELSLAAINADSFTVVAGACDLVEKLNAQFEERGVECRLLHIPCASHSTLMEPIMDAFAQEVKKIELHPPQLPYISNVSGTWITPEEATDPYYWVDHLRQTVRFSEGLAEILKTPNQILLEVGPGRSLSSFARQHQDQKPNHLILTTMRHPKEQQADSAFLLNTIGKIWLNHGNVDWEAFYEREYRYRVSLPAYPFEKRSYWVEPNPLDYQAGENTPKMDKKSDMGDWFYVPTWQRLVDPVQSADQSAKSADQSAKSADKSAKSADKSAKSADQSADPGWLILADEKGLGSALATRLRKKGASTVIVRVGENFSKNHEEEYRLNPSKKSDFERLIQELKAQNKLPERILHLWTLDKTPQPVLENLDQIQDRGFYSLIYLTQTLGQAVLRENRLRIDAVTANLYEVTGEDLLYPEDTPIIGAIKIIPQEYQSIKCRNIDISLADLSDDPASKKIDADMVDRILMELEAENDDPIVAHRGKYRWRESFEPAYLKESPPIRLKNQGVYLVTGGLGGVGFSIAKGLAEKIQARLILLGRSSSPPRDEWQKWLAEHDEKEATSEKIRRMMELEEMGAQFRVFSADVGDLEQMRKVVEESIAHFGQINGVIHSAGVADYAGIIHARTRDDIEEVMRPKVRGTLVLDRVLRDAKPDFIALCSSLSSILYHTKFGQVAYCAANEFLDAYSYHKTASDGLFTVAINWTDWVEVGLSVKAAEKWAESYDGPSLLLDEITPTEGVEIFQRIVESTYQRVATSTRDLKAIKNEVARIIKTFLNASEKKNQSKSSHQRPKLNTDYAAPRDDIETALVGIWQDLLGVSPVGVNDNFFDLGGHSLLGTQLVSRVQEQFHTTLPLQSLFEKSTVAQLSDFIRQLQSTQVFSDAPTTSGEREEIEI